LFHPPDRSPPGPFVRAAFAILNDNHNQYLSMKDSNITPLVQLKGFIGASLTFESEKIGKCMDFLIEIVRYIVARPGGWMSSERVILSPLSIQDHRLDPSNTESIPLIITQQQLESAPGIEDYAPVSRIHEQAVSRYFNWPAYWTGPSAWGAAMIPSPEAFNQIEAAREEAEEKAHQQDSNLRSFKELLSYHIQTEDDEKFGNINDAFIEADSWRLRAFSMDTSAWLPGREVALPAETITDISWHQCHLRVDLAKATVAEAPGLPEDRQASVQDLVPLISYYENAQTLHTSH